MGKSGLKWFTRLGYSIGNRCGIGLERAHGAFLRGALNYPKKTGRHGGSGDIARWCGDPASCNRLWVNHVSTPRSRTPRAMMTTRSSP